MVLENPLAEGSTPELARDVLAKAEREQVRFVNLQFTDVVGLVKSVTIPFEQFPDAIAQGKWFDGSAIEGFALLEIAVVVEACWTSMFPIIDDGAEL